MIAALTETYEILALYGANGKSAARGERMVLGEHSHKAVMLERYELAARDVRRQSYKAEIDAAVGKPLGNIVIVAV